MRRDGQHFHVRFPGMLTLSLGSVGWAISSSAIASLGLYLQNRLETDNLADIVLLFFFGGLLGWLLAVGAFGTLSPTTPLVFRFTAACVLISFFTLASAALLFALQYRAFYAQWHAPAFSRIWFFQQFFTTLGAIYQFSVIGLRLYFPLAFFPILVASAIVCRRTH